MTLPIDPSMLPPLSDGNHALRSEYQSALDSLDDELISGAALVADAMPHVVRAFLAGDRRCLDEAQANATSITEACRRIEEHGFILIAREAPVSGDLRRLVSILRLVHDLERSGRLMLHVAESVDKIDPRLLPPELRQQLEELALRAIEVFRGGVDAWRQRDGLAVHDLDRADSAVDTLRTGLVVRARELEGAAADVLVLGLLARYFERLADHGVAFAQHVTFVVTGTRVEVGP